MIGQVADEVVPAVDGVVLDGLHKVLDAFFAIIPGQAVLVFW